MGYLKSILAGLSALKEILNIFKFIWAKYEKRQERKRLEELQRAINNDKNQIPLEKAIGSDNAGKPTKRREGIEVEKSK